MRLYRTFAVCICVVGLSSHVVIAGGNMEVFRESLRVMGGRLDCHFTVESVGPVGSIGNPILDSMVDVDYEGVKTVDAMVASLRKTSIVWEFRGETSTIRLLADRIMVGNRAVIRIRDARIPDIAGYALDKKVLLSYEGTPYGLVQLLSTKDPLIQRQTVGVIGAGPIMEDTATRVRVNVTNGVVRDLLTECVPLAGYNRVVWSSYTDGKAKSPVVTVKFHGQAQR